MASKTSQMNMSPPNGCIKWVDACDFLVYLPMI